MMTRRQRSVLGVVLVLLGIALAAAAASRADAGFTPTPAPRPTFSAPVRVSSPPPSATPKAYSPPAKPYAPPPVTQRPAGAPVSAFHDTHSSLYWANPASPYYYLYLQQYGDGGSEDAGPLWLWLVIIGGVCLVVAITAIWMIRA